MPTCFKHKTVYKYECSSCVHEKVRDKEFETKANEKKLKDLDKLKIKNSQPKPAINKVSDKRKELNKEYFKLVDQFKHDNPTCKVRVTGCTNATEDPHHQRGRGKYLLDVSTWLPVCRNCHIFVENNPEEAKEKGWSQSRLEINQEPHKI